MADNPANQDRNWWSRFKRPIIVVASIATAVLAIVMAPYAMAKLVTNRASSPVVPSLRASMWKRMGVALGWVSSSIPLASHYIGEAHSLPNHLSSTDIWKHVVSLGAEGPNYAHNLLDALKKSSANVPSLAPPPGLMQRFFYFFRRKTLADNIQDVQTTIDTLVSNARALYNILSDSAKTRGISIEKMTDEMGVIFEAIPDAVKATFLSPHNALGHEQRKEIVQSVLQKVEEALLRFAEKHEIPADNLRSAFEKIKSPMERLVVLIGDLSEQYPNVRNSLVLSVVFAIIPPIPILAPILKLFGFGPAGPMKGSSASWMQRVFFGAVIPKGSWFSHLQRAAMKPSSYAWISGIFSKVGGCWFFKKFFWSK